MPAISGNSFLVGALLGIQAVSDGLPLINAWQRPTYDVTYHCIEGLVVLSKGNLKLTDQSPHESLDSAFLN